MIEVRGDGKVAAKAPRSSPCADPTRSTASASAAAAQALGRRGPGGRRRPIVRRSRARVTATGHRWPPASAPRPVSDCNARAMVCVVFCMRPISAAVSRLLGEQRGGGRRVSGAAAEYRARRRRTGGARPHHPACPGTSPAATNTAGNSQVHECQLPAGCSAAWQRRGEVAALSLTAAPPRPPGPAVSVEACGARPPPVRSRLWRSPARVPTLPSK